MTDFWYNVGNEIEVYENLFKESNFLPNDLIEYQHQIGGHGLLFGNKCKSNFYYNLDIFNFIVLFFSVFLYL